MILVFKKQLNTYLVWCAVIFTLHWNLFAEPSAVLSAVSSTSIIPDYFFSDADSVESHFQDGIETLFNYYNKMDIDTVGWSTSRINDVSSEGGLSSGTIKISLVDSSFVFPFKNYVTSTFGPRKAFFHYGVDIKVKTGDSIRCALDGLVRIVQNDKYGFGRVVVVRHHNGIETIYGHLSKCLVEVNTRVTAGEIIALGGNTGKSSGSHLHFEMRYLGEPFDPMLFMDFENYTLKSDTLVLTPQTFAYMNDMKNALIHKVKSGETLSGIAIRYGTTVRKICALNKLTTESIIKAGKKLIVRQGTPTPSKTVQKIVEVSSDSDG